MENESPYTKVLRERGKAVNATFPPAAETESREERDNRMRNMAPIACKRCHQQAKPYLQTKSAASYSAGTWYWKCEEITCNEKWEMEGQKIQGELQLEHGGEGTLGPLCYGTYDVYSRSWSSTDGQKINSQSAEESDIQKEFGFRPGLRIMHFRDRLYDTNTGWIG